MHNNLIYTITKSPHIDNPSLTKSRSPITPNPPNKLQQQVIKMEWDPTQFFRDNHTPINPFALLILNQPINERAFRVLKKHGMPSYLLTCIYMVFI
jgi:hypothetical protein